MTARKVPPLKLHATYVSASEFDAQYFEVSFDTEDPGADLDLSAPMKPHTFFSSCDKRRSQQLMYVRLVHNGYRRAKSHSKLNSLDGGGELPTIHHGITESALTTVGFGFFDKEPIEIQNEQVWPLQFGERPFRNIGISLSGFDRLRHVARLLYATAPSDDPKTYRRDSEDTGESGDPSGKEGRWVFRRSLPEGFIAFTLAVVLIGIFWLTGELRCVPRR